MKLLQNLFGKNDEITLASPVDGKLCSPADATVTTVLQTGHAVAGEGQKVKTGDLLIEADLESIRAEGYDIITPVIICNSDQFSGILPETEKEIAKGDRIFVLRK